MFGKSNGIVAEENNGGLVLILCKEIYQKDSITFASYKFIDKCYIFIEPTDKQFIKVHFERKEGVTISLNRIAGDFCNEVLDQQIRLMLEKSYASIREKIVQQAFSPITK